MTENELAEVAVEAAFRVHREVGPGLLEHAYVRCMHHELIEMGIATKFEHSVPMVYKGVSVGIGYRLDLWLEDKMIIEAKAVETILPIHRAQLMAYLKLTNNKLGLLLNFNVKLMKDGIERWANGMPH
ncbi:MAG: GxxExxY protein [Flavobacteriales bacterium]|jgi:GxxExxY protein|nr:GxxExxY protein [Flavobacteriales bacterium]